MLIIKNQKELNKFKKVDGNTFIYQFDEDVIFDFKPTNRLPYEKIKDKKLKECNSNMEKVMLVLDEDYRPRIIYKGKNMTFNKDVDWIDKLKLEGNLICKGEINGNVFLIDDNVDAEKIVCQILCCKHLKGNYVSIDDLFCKGDINCKMLKIDHISSCDKLNAGAMIFNGTMLYHVSAIGEDLGTHYDNNKR